MDLNTQEVHLSHYWNVIYKRWKVAVSILAVVMLGTYLASEFAKPLYRSNIQIQIEREIGRASCLPILKRHLKAMEGCGIDPRCRDARDVPGQRVRQAALPVKHPDPDRAGEPESAHRRRSLRHRGIRSGVSADAIRPAEEPRPG